MTDAPTTHGSPLVCARIEAILEAAGAPYEVIEHPPLSGSGSAEHAASLRGTPLEIGGKALLLKADGDFHLVAFSAARRLKSNRFRRGIRARRLRFATPDELAALTGLVPGCVPPFGEPVLPFPLHVDQSLLEQDRLAFTPGLLTRSFVMATADFQAVARPAVGAFTEPG